MKRIVATAALCGFAFAVAAPAQAGDGVYWKTRDGKILKSSKTGKCFKTRYWTPGQATGECKDKGSMSASK